ncbi:MAG: hypothetical protein ACLQVL_15400 [Terriglobia bacterium]
MAKLADVILIVVAFGIYAALLLYKLILFCRYRNDPAKREILIWQPQVYPDRLKRFFLDEHVDMSARKASPPNPARK